MWEFSSLSCIQQHPHNILIRLLGSIPPQQLKKRIFSWLSTVYDKIDQTSLPPKFMSDYVSHNNPFANCIAGSELFVLWNDFLKSHPQFAIDLTIAAGKNWGGITGPCDIAVRSNYMEEEFDLNKRWEEQILQNKTKATIEAAAKASCLRSLVQLRHLNRDKANY
jgi:hypothetical protein